MFRAYLGQAMLACAFKKYLTKTLLVSFVIQSAALRHLTLSLHHITLGIHGIFFPLH